MKSYLFLFAIYAAIEWSAVAGSLSVSGKEDAALAEFFGRYLTRHFEQQPLAATTLGDHHLDGQLDDISPAARGRWLTLDRTTLAALPKAVDYKKLSRDGQIDFEIFQHELRKDIWLTENTHPFEEDPRTYGNYLNDSVYLLLAQSTAPKETNIANSIARMKAFPGIIAAAKEMLTHPPRSVLETAIRQNRGAIGFYESDIYRYAGDTPQLPTLKACAARVVEQLKSYQEFLENELMARANGEWRLGKKRFATKLDLELNAGLSAERVLAEAEAEFKEVRGNMYVIARQLWPVYFPGADLPPDDASGRRETILRVIAQVNHDHGTADELVGDVGATVERIKQFISSHHYLRLPEPDQCQVVEMPAFRRGNSLAYLENAPPLDRSASSYFAVSPPPADWTDDQKNSFLEEYNRQMLQILTIHEAYPGHYVQLEYANRNPSLIRRVYQSSPYVEGWAVYGEVTMLNRGYGAGNLPLRLMQLKFYLRAVANAILDNKMHCTQMTDAEAMNFLVGEAFQSEGEAKLKVIRAKQSSTQLSSYFVGRMAHYRLEQQVAREMGVRFDLAEYHEAVLSPGSIPVKYLPEIVRDQLHLRH